MTYETIKFTVSENVATLTLNRPEMINGLNAVMRHEILDAVTRAGNSARVLVITGAGKGFCSGQDLTDVKSLDDLDLESVLRDEYVPMLNAIYNCPIPTIAAVNGPAAGAGANLALAPDIVIAKETAFFQQGFANIGLIPDAGGTYWLPRQVGFARAMGAALFAERISGREAADMGMIFEAVPDADFDAHIAKRAAHLANGPTGTYNLIKQAIRKSYDNTLKDQLVLEGELQNIAGCSSDFSEGVAAFLEKRKPNFSGH
jgi:2-(1,2-epoxy-1,2-dihydrophenyl)acetyl-CoA isomerase